jgi:hypothetical protein
MTRELARIVHEEARAFNPEPEAPKPLISEKQITALDSLLTGKGPLDTFETVVASQTGDPLAYETARKLIGCFKKHGWIADGGFYNFENLNGVVVFVQDSDRVPSPIGDICEALTASGIGFHLRSLDDLGVEQGFIFIGKHY